MKRNLFILMVLFISIIGYSQTIIFENITYQITSNTNNTVQITDYNTAGGTVVDIPNTVSYNSESFSVTHINNSAFADKGLTSVDLPSTLITIGNLTFRDNLLTSLSIPNSVTSIGGTAFYNNLLDSVILSDNLTSIGVNAFSSNKLISIIIPNSVTSIGSHAFYNNHLTNVIIGNGISNIANNVFSKNELVSLNIPNTITSISQSAFSSNKLVNITIPNNVTVIKAGTFSSNQLISLIISDNVTSIESNAFSNNNLVFVSLGNSVASIGAGAFKSNPLTTITIPSSVNSIGDSAFKDDPLTTVISESIIPANVTTANYFTDTFWARGNIDLIIPHGTIDAYVNNAGALWTGFNTVTEAAALGATKFEFINNIKLITTKDGLKVNFSNNIRLQRYRIYSIFGALVGEGRENKILTSFLSNGIYILKLDFDKGVFTKKIMNNLH